MPLSRTAKAVSIVHLHMGEFLSLANTIVLVAGHSPEITALLSAAVEQSQNNGMCGSMPAPQARDLRNIRKIPFLPPSISIAYVRQMLYDFAHFNRADINRIYNHASSSLSVERFVL